MVIYSEKIIKEMQRTIRREQRVLRIFMKYGPVLHAGSVTLSSDGDGTLTLSCPSSEKANWAAFLLRLPPPAYSYVGRSAAKEAMLKDGDIKFHFYANDVREIHFKDCYVKRQRRSTGHARRAKLFFNDWELADVMYPPAYTKAEELKKMLWAVAKQKLECDLRYRMVD